MAILHVVMFQFKALIPLEEVAAGCDRMLVLGDKCIHPTTQAPYVKVLGGGKDNSPEGLQNGITHTFVFQFENEDDRKHYIEKDAAHLEFIASIKNLVQKVQVVDFTPGVY
ncbi:Uu.00g138950.m01.CDS01 [Anthostomella pinea]|uniref:Uu.00g138950.m01.CDS01 n=1 Tax=Anthostomella pinea TaxID=933095 RepID=A0AAI8YL96_9PEZI|nr:Uu.00g138950.m01.CDS01 [Anthostomella pinea]